MELSLSYSNFLQVILWGLECNSNIPARCCPGRLSFGNPVPFEKKLGTDTLWPLVTNILRSVFLIFNCTNLSWHNDQVTNWLYIYVPNFVQFFHIYDSNIVWYLNLSGTLFDTRLCVSNVTEDTVLSCREIQIAWRCLFSTKSCWKKKKVM